MVNTLYLLITLAVALFAIITGFRRGITGQMSSVLGFSFGAVAARIGAPEFSKYFYWTEKVGQAPEFNEFSANLVCAITIYTAFFWIFSLTSGIFRGAFSVVTVGMFNRLLGSFFALVKNLLWVSILYNLLLCFNPGSGLLRYERANDGNLVSAVMSLTPGILGCYGAEDFAHFHQLKEAKSISQNKLKRCPTEWESRNFKGIYNVITIEG